ncbi:MAG: LuxR C-terminal-related transcriptional regulator [Cryobacterium sp.]|uniref:helix-turn-helix transcriptional regulator n=1 Tax=unclassified Cryobacterium TaxID=2649013 RepID=UPI0018C9B65D|nr:MULTISPECIES: LuxR C-terminal-related transcriptional regulator [unclassified Cryobacterium]MCY7403938.1 LuxR C-terminal-related transcriptional regulator [Cryobacterium sp.]MEC5155329.1 DNA-binding CsgD family transcriptional regulator [Cryobacterium sp. CAN_C3]
MTNADLDARVAATVRRIHSLAGVPLVFGGIVQHRSRLQLQYFAGATVGALSGVQVDSGTGLGGHVLAVNQPMAVDDYLTTGRFRHRYDRFVAAENLHAMVAVPVIVARRPVAIIYGASHAQETFGSKVFDVMVAEARALEQRIAVDAALAERAEEAIILAEAPHGVAIEEIYSELRVLAASIADAPTRAAVLRACGRMIGREGATSVLTAREVDVVAEVALGRSNADIAERLGLAPNTVKSYMRTIMQKLQSNTRYEAVRAARQQGLLP